MEQSSKQDKWREKEARWNEGATAQEKPDKGSSLLGSGLRNVVRGAAKLGAWDVLVRDAKRIKPRYPKLWRDLWGLRRTLRSAEPTGPITAGKSVAVALSVTIITVLMTVYFALLLVGYIHGRNVDLAALIATGAICIGGAFQAACYWKVSHILKRKSRSSAPQSLTIQRGDEKPAKNSRG